VKGLTAGPRGGRKEMAQRLAKKQSKEDFMLDDSPDSAPSTEIDMSINWTRCVMFGFKNKTKCILHMRQDQFHTNVTTSLMIYQKQYRHSIK